MTVEHANGVYKQRKRALVDANATRRERARIKQELKLGVIRIDSVLEHPPATCAKVPVFDVLQWAPKIGRTAALRLTRGLVSETLPLRCLGPTTREQLLARIAHRG